MSYTFNDNFVAFDFMYKSFSHVYKENIESIDESSRLGFEAMYIGSSSGLRKFIERQRESQTEVSKEVMDIAWRRMEGMESTLIELLENKESFELVA